MTIEEIMFIISNWTWEWIPAVVLGIPVLGAVAYTFFAFVAIPGYMIYLFWENIFKCVHKHFKKWRGDETVTHIR
jgi:hypothetical protein